MQLEFNFDADPELIEIENLIGEPVERMRIRNVYRSSFSDTQIKYYDVLTADSVYDISICDDSHYSKVFAKYKRDTFPSRQLERILDSTGNKPIIHIL